MQINKSISRSYFVKNLFKIDYFPGIRIGDGKLSTMVVPRMELTGLQKRKLFMVSYYSKVGCVFAMIIWSEFRLINFLDSDSDSDFELPRRPSLVARGFSSLRRSCRKVTRSMAKITFTKAGFQSS